MRFQGRGAEGSNERLFLAESAGPIPQHLSRMGRVGLGCAYKRFDFSLFRLLSESLAFVSLISFLDKKYHVRGSGFRGFREEQGRISTRKEGE